LLSIFIYVWQQNIGIRLAYKISYLNNIYEQILAENDILKLKINTILSIDTIYQIAKERNFAFPNKNSIFYIN
jgi:predicted glycosyltransferase involved in capsule biosynthesis